ncbi:MAG: hypothetical protein AAFX40_19345, partial [Cyanobacteria bacterium J06639_1]
GAQQGGVIDNAQVAPKPDERAIHADNGAANKLKTARNSTRTESQFTRAASIPTINKCVGTRSRSPPLFLADEFATLCKPQLGLALELP